MKYSYVAHDCILENNVTMSAGSKLAGYCYVSENVNLGMGVAIHQKLIIPQGVMIGMNGVVTKRSKLLQDQKYAGVPIRHIGSNEKY
jgi:UDP-N-acetylglucosamine acyltransferase